MSDHVDRARAPREGEALDGARLATYLRARLPELASAGDIETQQFPSGHSNLTYLVRAGEREYVLRRPPFGTKVKSAHDMSREFKVLSHLHGAYPKAPEPVLFCDDHDVMGADFYVMRRVRGIILRKSVPADLDLGPERMRRLQLTLIDGLAELHALDFAALGLGDLGKPEGYVQRQVAGWTKRYAGSRTDDIPAVDEVARWLAEHLPPESGAALIHNDYKLDNVVLDPADPTRIIGVLDWEMSTVGDPLMDLGTTLSYWTEATDPEVARQMSMGPTDAPGSLTRAEVVARYAEASGRSVQDVAFYFAFGLFKTAVVLQQIYYRYQQGLTQDARFASLIWGVGLLANNAREVVQRGRV